MGRKKCDVSHTGSGVVRHQRDTPIKTALRRRHRHRILLPKRHYEALPEEMTIPTEDRPTSPAWTSNKPVQCKSVSHKVVSPAAPTDHHVSEVLHTPLQMTPDLDAFKGGEIPAKDESKKKRNTAEMAESITSSGIETDSTFTFDDGDDEEDSSASSSPSGLTSPEIFRNYEETLAFPMSQELLSFHLPTKNSTLLDVSHAETIHMHDPPNISTITESSPLLAETNSMRNNTGPEVETEIQRKSFQSDNQAKTFRRKTPIKLTNKRPFLCKKKVWFKTPVMAEILQAKHVPATVSTVHNTSETARAPGPVEWTSETAFGDDTLRLTVTLKRPERSRPEKAEFFDFVSDSDRDLFFQRARRRCVELQSITLFPVVEAENTDASVR